jgi:hypothetical protein
MSRALIKTLQQQLNEGANFYEGVPERAVFKRIDYSRNNSNPVATVLVYDPAKPVWITRIYCGISAVQPRNGTWAVRWQSTPVDEVQFNWYGGNVNHIWDFSKYPKKINQDIENIFTKSLPSVPEFMAAQWIEYLQDDG